MKVNVISCFNNLSVVVHCAIGIALEESDVKWHQLILDRKVLDLKMFFRISGLYDIIKGVVKLSVLWPVKFMKKVWRNFQLQIMLWEIQGVDPRYAVAPQIYPIQAVSIDAIYYYLPSC